MILRNKKYVPLVMRCVGSAILLAIGFVAGLVCYVSEPGAIRFFSFLVGCSTFCTGSAIALFVWCDVWAKIVDWSEERSGE